MPNYTFEDYKNAIKAKYEDEKKGKYSNNLNSPTTAKLRKLCVKRFDSNTKKDDLIIFESFFEFPFNKDKKNLYGDNELNKLTSVRRFFLGKTENPSEDTVEFSAILVDFQPRPFLEFIRFDNNGELEFKENTFKHSSTEAENKNSDREEKTYVPLPFITNDTSASNIKEQEITNNNEFVSNDAKPDFKLNETQFREPERPEIKKQRLIRKIKGIVFENFLKRLGKTVAVIVLIFCSIGGIIYFAFFKKHCMQWTGDHYEIVDCSSSVKSGFYEIIPLDESLLDFKKLKACDTTTCFKKNGEAFVWYGKTINGVDFFNDNGTGRHPENKAALRPITHYMFNKYLKGKQCE